MMTYAVEKTHSIKLSLFDVDVGFIEMKNYDITYNIITDIGGDNDIDLAQDNQNKSFAKINAFIDSMIDQSLVLKNLYSPDDDAARHAALSDFDNNIILLPVVHESVLLAAIHCKLNSIISTDTFVEKVMLKDTTTGIKYELNCDDDDPVYYELPPQSEWQGKLSYWDKPWWYRSDCSTFDRTASNEQEYKVWLEQKPAVDIANQALFRDIAEIVDELTREHGNNTPGGEVVEVDFSKKDGPWKPELV